ncbi:MAG: carbon-nitrogen family hydrolase [Lachnospiraceae bacterium]|nr:carbon-nitrogen family hydrolase [Lachnospiraceae bacterium]
MKIAMAQMNIIWESKEENKVKCIDMVKEAKANLAGIIVFPEMTLTGFTMNTMDFAEPEENQPTLDFFLALSKKYEIAIAFGMAVSGEKGVHNRLYIVKNGEVILSYDKIHPFTHGLEGEFYVGGERLETVEIDGIRFGASICYDLRFPEVYQLQADEADAILVIANWPSVRKKHFHVLLHARAVENQCYIIGVNRTGKGGGMKYSGGSVIVMPDGNTLTEETKDETIIYGEISKDEVEKNRDKFSIRADRKEHLYQRLWKLKHNKSHN